MIDAVVTTAAVAAAAVALLLPLALVLVASPRLFVLATAAYIVFVPKLTVLAVPGTTVGLRGEDLLLSLLLLKVLGDLLARRVTLPRPARTITVWLLLLLPVGLVGILVGTAAGTVEDPAIAAMFLLRRYEYFVLFLGGVAYFSSAREARGLVAMLEASVHFHFGVALLQAAGLVGGFRFGVYRPVPPDRVISTFGGAYELAAYLIVVLPLFVWMVLRTPRRLAGVVGVVLVLVTTWMTQARTSIAAGLVLVVVMVAVLQRNKLVLLAAAVPAAAGLALWAPTAARSVSGSRFGSLDVVEMWQATVRGGGGVGVEPRRAATGRTR
uniref:hypothetical protein n=1 Tax=Cellulomonas endophytica TaxID=2494735 RepID=UPI0013E938C4